MLIKISSCAFSNVYKKLSRLLKVTAGQVSMHKRSECYVMGVFLRLRNSVCCDASCVHFLDFFSPYLLRIG